MGDEPFFLDLQEIDGFQAIIHGRFGDDGVGSDGMGKNCDSGSTGGAGKNGDSGGMGTSVVFPSICIAKMHNSVPTAYIFVASKMLIYVKNN